MSPYGRWGKGSSEGLVWDGRCGLIRALGAWLAIVTSDSLGRYGVMKEGGIFFQSVSQSVTFHMDITVTV